MREAPIKKDGSSIPSHQGIVINKKLFFIVSFLHRPIEAPKSLFKTF
jgi:hypothetical protein